uniref:Immunoglobulin C1-set domain-containing protein n=1 Tax=Cyanoderma ruficeps TaxID=181631 RepID=A0A8C3QKY6_9PASS
LVIPLFLALGSSGPSFLGTGTCWKSHPTIPSPSVSRPSLGAPPYMEKGFVDGIPFVHCDSDGNSMDASHRYPIPEPPDVHVSGKEEHGTLILFSHTYGFYPNTIAVNWMKGDEIWDQETEWGGVVPNSDGAFHTWASIEAVPDGASQNAGAWDLRLG